MKNTRCPLYNGGIRLTNTMPKTSLNTMNAKITDIRYLLMEIHITTQVVVLQ